MTDLFYQVSVTAAGASADVSAGVDTLVIDERELNYYLVQFGPLPEVPNYAETFTYTEFGGVTTSSKLIPEYNWAIYRLGNGGA